MLQLPTLHVLFAVAFALLLGVSHAGGDNAAETALSDEIQARLRVSNCVLHGPSVDVYVDGEVAINGGTPQTGIEPLFTWGYHYLTPGAHSVALVPTGAGLDQALVGPIKVTVEAGHRYTVAMLGQNDDPSHEALVIDETAAYEAIGVTPTDRAHISINNLEGVAGLKIRVAEAVVEPNVPHGEFQAAIWPSGYVDGYSLTVAGKPDEVLEATTGQLFFAPASDSLLCYAGRYPGNVTADFDWLPSIETSGLDAVAYLARYNSANQGGYRAPTFEIFLSAIKAAELGQTLATGGPHLLLVPTDSAFLLQYPADELEALKADPNALADIARYHIAEGYYPFGNLPSPETSESLSITNLLGSEIVFTGFGIYNGEPAHAVHELTLKNGSFIHAIDRVLTPVD